MANKGMSKEELIERYIKAKPLPYTERMAEYNRLYGASKRYYGSWQKFRETMGDKKKENYLSKLSPEQRILLRQFVKRFHEAYIEGRMLNVK